MIRTPLAILAAFLDRLGRYEAAATIAGFATSSLTETAFPELGSAITDLRDVLGDETYESLARKGGPLRLDEAIQRVNRYAAAGADIAFVEAPQGVDEIERIAREVDAPLLINLAEGGLTPLVSDARLQELGYAIALHTTDVFTRSTLGALQAMCDVVGIEPADSPATPEGFFNLVGLREWTDTDARYAQKDARSWA